jgi:hypothetical protein
LKSRGLRTEDQQEGQMLSTASDFQQVTGQKLKRLSVGDLIETNELCWYYQNEVHVEQGAQATHQVFSASF